MRVMSETQIIESGFWRTHGLFSLSVDIYPAVFIPYLDAVNSSNDLEFTFKSSELSKGRRDGNATLAIWN